MKANLLPALKWGVINGIVSVIVSMLIYLIKPDFFGSFLLLPFFIMLTLFFMIWGGISYRKDNDDKLTFFEAFVGVFIITFIGMVFSTIFTYILTHYIDPNLMEMVKNKVIENTTQWLEKAGKTDEEIEKVMSAMKDQDFNLDIKQTLIRLFSNSIVLAVFSLIVAAFIKRNPDAVQPILPTE